MSEQQQPANNGGYDLSPPPETPAAPPAHPPLQATSEAPPPTVHVVFSQNDATAAAGIVFVLAIAFFLVKSGLRSHLISTKASPSSASNASWALFAFLLSLSATIVFGFFGNLLQMLAFVLPMGGLVLVLLIVFIVLFNGARRVRH